MEAVPTDGVDGHVVRVVRVQELIVVRFGALVNFTLFCADDEEIILMLVEIEARSASFHI